MIRTHFTDRRRILSLSGLLISCCSLSSSFSASHTSWVSSFGDRPLHGVVERLSPLPSGRTSSSTNFNCLSFTRAACRLRPRPRQQNLVFPFGLGRVRRDAVMFEDPLKLNLKQTDSEVIAGVQLDPNVEPPKECRRQQLSSLEMDDPEDESNFSVRLLDASALMEEKMDFGGRIYDSRIKQSYDEWVDTWKDDIPQQTILKQNLPRDRWVPLSIPTTFGRIAEQMGRPEVQKYLQDPQQRNYFIYSSGRTVFFFLSSVLTALLQINVQVDAFQPVSSGKALRKEVSAALKRIAMSGEGKNETNSETSIPRIERVFRLFGSIAELYRRDCENIAHGIYRYPYDANLRHRQFNPFFVRKKFLNTFREAVDTGMRRARKGRKEIVRELKLRQLQALGGTVLVSDPFSDSPNLLNDRLLVSDLSKYPDYYLQNFHWQTDGWMSSRSAFSYEYTTESLFSGSQDAMQRQGLVSISEFVTLNKGIKNEEELTLLEVACGTGRQHTFIKDNWPKMRTTACDLSPFYLQVAEENLYYFKDFTRSVTGREVAPTEFVQANAEDLPFEDESFDIVVCTYLFHELPHDVRRKVAAELFRVVAPGGFAVITDSFQKGDIPEKNHIAKRFPANYHEPYYMDYFENTDLVEMFQTEGFTMRRHQCAHLSKVLTFEKLDPTLPRIAPYKMWAIV